MSWPSLCHGPPYVMGLLMSWASLCYGPLYVMSLLLSWPSLCYGPPYVMGLLMLWASLCYEPPYVILLGNAPLAIIGLVLCSSYTVMALYSTGQKTVLVPFHLIGISEQSILELFLQISEEMVFECRSAFFFPSFFCVHLAHLRFNLLLGPALQFSPRPCASICSFILHFNLSVGLMLHFLSIVHQDGVSSSLKTVV